MQRDEANQRLTELEEGENHLFISIVMETNLACLTEQISTL